MDFMEFGGAPSGMLMFLLFWMPFLVPLVVAIAGLVMLQRILAGQRAIRARLESIEQRLSQSSES